MASMLRPNLFYSYIGPIYRKVQKVLKSKPTWRNWEFCFKVLSLHFISEIQQQAAIDESTRSSTSSSSSSSSSSLLLMLPLPWSNLPSHVKFLYYSHFSVNSMSSCFSIKELFSMEINWTWYPELFYFIDYFCGASAVEAQLIFFLYSFSQCDGGRLTEKGKCLNFFINKW